MHHRKQPRTAAIDWSRVYEDLDTQGAAVVDGLLSRAECEGLAGLYAQEEAFRSRVVMSRHGFGRGEYKYFAYPLPTLVGELRASLYPHLVPIANRWNEALGIDVRYPDDHASYLQRCHAAGQDRPTPLLLAYGEGDYNCLHQDDEYRILIHPVIVNEGKRLFERLDGRTDFRLISVDTFERGAILVKYAPIEA
jgi:uncharacterized protein